MQKEVVTLGKTRVSSSFAWIIVGLAVGFTLGVGLLANMEGNLELASLQDSNFTPLSTQSNTNTPDSLESLTFDLLESGEEVQAQAEEAGVPLETITGTADQTSLNTDTNSNNNLSASLLAALSPGSPLQASIDKATQVAQKRQVVMEANVPKNTEKVLKVALSQKLKNIRLIIH